MEGLSCCSEGWWRWVLLRWVLLLVGRISICHSTSKQLSGAECHLELLLAAGCSSVSTAGELPHQQQHVAPGGLLQPWCPWAPSAALAALVILEPLRRE